MKKILFAILTLCSFAFCEFSIETQIDNAIYPIEDCKKINPKTSPWNSISVNSERNNKDASKVAYECKNMSFYMIQVNNKLNLFLSGKIDENVFIIRLLTENDYKTEDGEYIDVGVGRYEEMDENNIIVIDESSQYNESEAVKAKIFEIYNIIKTKKEYPEKIAECPPSWQDNYGNCKNGW